MQYIYAFITGGLLCVVAQILIDKTKLTPARILVIYVTAGVILTAVGLSISFSDTQLTATNAYTDETTTIALTDLASMKFSNTDETTGIHTIHANETNDKKNAIYNLQGEQLPVNATLPKGIYIIKKENETQKVIVK